MHLIDLIAELEAEKIRSGNVKLHGAAVLVEGAAKPLVDYYSGAPLPMPERIDITGMSKDQIRELKAEHPGALFLVRKPDSPAYSKLDESEQALEDESKNAPAGAPIVKVPEDAHMRELEAKAVAEAKAQLGQAMETAAAKLPGATGTTTMGSLSTSGTLSSGPMPCDHWNGKGRACVLAMAHDGDHIYNSDELYDQVAAAQQPDSLQE